MVNIGHAGVTVKHGSVRGFAIGVFVGRARDNRVLDISSSKNILFGFVVAESSRQPGPRQLGKRQHRSEGRDWPVRLPSPRLLGNSFAGNPLGIHVEDSTDNLIEGNVFSSNDLGILMEADGNQGDATAAFETARGSSSSGSRNVITRNRYSRNKGGIAIEKGRGNLVARNVVVDARRIGNRLGLQRPEQLGGVNNVVRRNLVKGSGVRWVPSQKAPIATSRAGGEA